jgi:hypothetical protein
MRNTLRIAIVKVLVFTPPPVDTGDAPTHIRNIIISIVAFVNASILTLLNPAVRGVTLEKYDIAIFPLRLTSFWVTLYSRKKMEIVPNNSRINVARTTIFVLKVIIPTL